MIASLSSAPVVSLKHLPSSSSLFALPSDPNASLQKEVCLGKKPSVVARAFEPSLPLSAWLFAGMLTFHQIAIAMTSALFIAVTPPGLWPVHDNRGSNVGTVHLTFTLPSALASVPVVPLLL